MKLNLDPVRKTVESLMVDECTITRDSEGTADDTWDPSSGTYTPPFIDRMMVYAGPCMVSSGGGSFVNEKGGAYWRVTPYMISLPAGSGPLAPEDIVTVTESERSPQLVGKTFYVEADLGSTYSVTYRASMHLRTQVPGSA